MRRHRCYSWGCGCSCIRSRGSCCQSLTCLWRWRKCRRCCLLGLRWALVIYGSLAGRPRRDRHRTRLWRRWGAILGCLGRCCRGICDASGLWQFGCCSRLRRGRCVPSTRGGCRRSWCRHIIILGMLGSCRLGSNSIGRVSLDWTSRVNWNWRHFVWYWCWMCAEDEVGRVEERARQKNQALMRGRYVQLCQVTVIHKCCLVLRARFFVCVSLSSNRRSDRDVEGVLGLLPDWVATSLF